MCGRCGALTRLDETDRLPETVYECRWQGCVWAGAFDELQAERGSGQLRLPSNRPEYCDGPQLPDLATVQLALATALISILVPTPRKRGWFSEKHDLAAAV